MEGKKRYRFSLNMSSDDYYAYYTGAVRNIIVTTHEGKTVKFPASVLRKLVTHKGIYGTFEMEIDQNNKFVDIKQINQKQSGDGVWM